MRNSPEMESIKAILFDSNPISQCVKSLRTLFESLTHTRWGSQVGRLLDSNSAGPTYPPWQVLGRTGRALQSSEPFPRVVPQAIR